MKNIHIFLLMAMTSMLTACGGSGGGTTNNVPIAEPQNLTIDEDVAVDITLNASDADDDALTYVIVTDPAHGLLSGTAPNITYTPSANYNGSDSVGFIVNDGTADSSTSTVNITVTAVNDAPVATDTGISLPSGDIVTGTLAVSDAEGDNLTFSIVTAASNGTVDITNASTGTYSYTHNGLASGDSFTFWANDGLLDSNIATVTVSTTAPTPATGLQATLGDQRITLNWDTIPEAESYNIYWSDITGTGTGGTVITGITPPFHHDSLTNGSNYYYVVTAVNAVGESAPSVELTATPVDILISSLSFADPNLDACVTAAALAPFTDLVYVYELTGLSCAMKGIVSLTGIEALTSLTFLDLHYNSIIDVNPLSGLTSLTDLRLYSNNISDVTPLSGLTNLTNLRLDTNSITDLAPLSGLSNLTELRLYSNNISDLPPLSGLTSLTTLDLGSNSVTNLNPLSGLSSLTYLSIAFNGITDVSPLSGLTSLTSLTLPGNSITDVGSLSSLTSLTYLNMYSNGITNIGSLSGMTSLTSLTLYNNSITDLTPLVGLTSLTYLNLRFNNITDVDSLYAMTSLTELYLYDNDITDVGPLSGLASLTDLELSFNNITDVSPLSSLTSLTDLDLPNNNITDVSPLSNLTGLIRLDLNYNNIGGQSIGNIDTLTSLLNLTGIFIQGNMAMSCAELGTLITELGSPPVDTDNSLSTIDTATNGTNCTNP